MTAGEPIQTAVIVSPSAHLLLAPHSSPVDKPAAQPIIRAGYMGNGGHVSTSQSSSPVLLTSNSLWTTGLTAAQSIARKEDLQLKSPDARDSEHERPIIGPKFQNQAPVLNDVDTTEDDDDDDNDNELYNYPRQDLYRPHLTGLNDVDTTEDDDDDDDNEVYNYPRQVLYRPHLTGFQQAEETYDTPAWLKPAAGSYDDTYDLPPPMNKHEAIDLNTDDDVYDIPPTKVSANASSDCVPPADYGVASHHSYKNVTDSVSVDAAGPELSNTNHTDRLLSADSSGSDISHDDIVVSSRTRSFRSSNSRCVLNVDLQSLTKFC